MLPIHCHDCQDAQLTSYFYTLDIDRVRPPYLEYAYRPASACPLGGRYSLGYGNLLLVDCSLDMRMQIHDLDLRILWQ